MDIFIFLSQAPLNPDEVSTGGFLIIFLLTIITIAYMMGKRSGMHKAKSLAVTVLSQSYSIILSSKEQLQRLKTKGVKTQEQASELAYFSVHNHIAKGVQNRLKKEVTDIGIFDEYELEEIFDSMDEVVNQ